MNFNMIDKNKWFQWILGTLMILVVFVLFVRFFESFSIEGTSFTIDWGGLHRAMQNGHISYQIGYLRIPPWGALVVAPLGYLSMQGSWGAIGFITMLVLVISVPRTEKKWLNFLSIFLLTVSIPALRHMVDGNFEALVIGGILLILYAYRVESPFVMAVGILLSICKPQEITLVMLVLAVHLLKTWSWQKLASMGFVLAIVIVPSMLWQGEEWLRTMLTIGQRGSIMDMSLISGLDRTTLFSPLAIGLIWGGITAVSLWIAWQSRATFTREKAGMLIVASLLTAPYAASNSNITILAVGIIPLFQKRPLLGGFLIALANASLFLNRPEFVRINAYYSTFYLVLCWAALNWHIYQEANATNNEMPNVPMLSDLETV